MAVRLRGVTDRAGNVIAGFVPQQVIAVHGQTGEDGGTARSTVLLAGVASFELENCAPADVVRDVGEGLAEIRTHGGLLVAGVAPDLVAAVAGRVAGPAQPVASVRLADGRSFEVGHVSPRLVLDALEVAERAAGKGELPPRGDAPAADGAPAAGEPAGGAEA